jgi:hypothetical protein
MKQMNATVAADLDEVRLQISSIRKWITRILEQNYSQIVSSDTPVDALFESLQTQIHLTVGNEKVLADALQLQRSLALSPGTSLSDEVTRMRKMSAHLQTVTAKQEEEIARLEAAAEKASRDFGDELRIWDHWGRSMCHRLLDRSATGMSPGNLRFLLEEAMLASIGHRTLIRRLEFLRAEKRFLTAAVGTKFGPVASGEVSIRQLLLVSLFAKRLQSMAVITLS